MLGFCVVLFAWKRVLEALYLREAQHSSGSKF